MPEQGATVPTHKNNARPPSSTCRSLQNHNRPKKDDKPIEPPYTPPTHKNNARSFLNLPFFAKSQPPKKG